MNHRLVYFAAALLVALTPAVSSAGGLADAFEGSDETFVAFPTYAAMQEDGSLLIPIRVWVFEPEEDSITRRILAELFEEALDVEDPEDEEIFEERVRPFLYDNERGKSIVATINGKSYEVGESAANGQVSTTIELPVADAMQAVVAGPGVYKVDVEIRGVDITRALEVPIIGRRGFSVVSDIDDTVKDSNVLDRKALLRNTFMKPFDDIDGMASAYQTLRESLGARFHYLSASPFQLYPFLDPWMHAAGFPPGTYHLRELRPSRPKSVKDFAGDSKPHKISSIEQLLDHMPERQFILIGDSGEADPEVYGEIARKHPDRVARILIRRVEGAENADERFEAAFEDLPVAMWMLFEDPSQIAATID
ncbi:MAG: phosphatidate phosphatase App1 family protein [Myxococcota bacterium]